MPEESNRWIERELERQMTPVQAPAGLWAGIQAERRARRAERFHARAGWMLWPAIAVVLLLASGDLVREAARARGSMVRFSDSELESMARESDLRIDSADPHEIRTWVKTHTNMDCDVACGRTEKVRLAGARLIRYKDELLAAISYRFEGHDGILFVARKGFVFERGGSTVSDKRLVSWTARDQSLTMTWPRAADLEAACRACHVDGHGLL